MTTDVKAIVAIGGDNENSPEEAAHHALRHLYEQLLIRSWYIPALDGDADVISRHNGSIDERDVEIEFDPAERQGLTPTEAAGHALDQLKSRGAISFWKISGTQEGA